MQTGQRSLASHSCSSRKIRSSTSRSRPAGPICSCVVCVITSHIHPFPSLSSPKKAVYKPVYAPATVLYLPFLSIGPEIRRTLSYFLGLTSPCTCDIIIKPFRAGETGATHAGVAELADARDLKSRGRDPVPVRPRSPAPYRGVEQLAARRAHNPEVVGSSPTSATIKHRISYEIRCFSALFVLEAYGSKSGATL